MIGCSMPKRSVILVFTLPPPVFQSIIRRKHRHQSRATVREDAMRGLRLAGRGVIVAAALILSARIGFSQTMDELYAKAKSEGRLVLYGGGPVEPFERWAKE